MKKIFLLILFISLFFITYQKASAVTFEQGFSSPKPLAILVTAPWADNATTAQMTFDMMSQKYGNKMNFAKIDLSTKSAYNFNKRYQVFTNIPYVMLTRDGGKFVRIVKLDCLMSSSCFKDKVELFVH